MELRKQAIGIDISKQTFTAFLGSLSQDSSIQLSPAETFDNSKNGTRYQQGYTKVAPTQKDEATLDSIA